MTKPKKDQVINTVQRRYTIKRLAAIKQKLIDTAEKKYIIADIEPTATEKLQLIKTGKVKFQLKKFLAAFKIQKKSNYNYMTRVNTYISVLEYPSSSNYFNFKPYSKKGRKDKVKLALTEERITAEFQRLSDEIMLGDAELGLKALKDFAKMKI